MQSDLVAAVVAFLTDRIGLRDALLIVPTCYMFSGIGFFFAEQVFANELKERAAQSPA